MAFVKETWNDGAGGGTPLSAVRLNGLEERVRAAVAEVQAAIAAGSANVLNVRRDFGAVGNNTVDDTAALTAAIEAAQPNQVIYIPPGIYKFTFLSLRSGLTIMGAGTYATVLRTSGPAAAGAKLLEAWNDTGITISDLTVDGANHANAYRGWNQEQANGAKRSRLERCRFINFQGDANGTGVYAWPANDVVVKDCVFEDCRFGVDMDEASGSEVTGCRFYGSGFVHEIRFRSFNSVDASSLVEGNRCLAGTIDRVGDGNEGAAIQTYNSRNMRIVGNVTRGSQASGIRVGAGCWGAVVEGNDAGYNLHWPTLYCETNIGETGGAAGGNITLYPTAWTDDAGRHRGVTIVGNHFHHALDGCGVQLSYTPGALFKGNEVDHCTGEGVTADADSVTFEGNVIYNNWFGNSAGVPSPGGVTDQAQIRTWGNRNKIVRNIVWDSQATKTSDYCLALTNAGHEVAGNEFRDPQIRAVASRGERNRFGWNAGAEHLKNDAPWVLARGSVAASATGNTTEQTLVTVPVTARTLGPNGRLRITTMWSMTNNANAKTPRIKLGGTTFAAPALTGAAAARLELELANRNNVASQVGLTSTLAIATGALNTDTADQSLTITGQLAVGTDTLTLEAYTVEVLPMVEP